MRHKRKLALWLLLGAMLLAAPALAGPKPEDLALNKTVYMDADGISVRKLVNTNPAPLGGTPEAVADAFLVARAQTLFGEPATAGPAGVTVGDITLVGVRTVSSISGYHVWKQATVRGVPVHNGYVVTHLTRDGRVLFVTSDVGLVHFSLPATRSALSSDGALRTAATMIGGDGALRGATTSDLVVLRQGGQDRLCWRTVTPTWNPYGDWQIFVDAVSGAEVARRDLLIVDGPDPKPAAMTPYVEKSNLPPYDPATALKVNGSGFVFLKNPLNDHPERYSWRDGEPLLDTVRDAVTLPNLDGTGYLRGPWVEVFNTDAARANEPTLVFDYSPRILNGHFQEVNVYQAIDALQTYIQNDLGIPDARNRVINCYAHQGEDDNSDYSSSLDRIRYGDGGVDDSDDQEVVVHEYGHAVHEDVVPGFVYAGESGAISEGLGDYFGGIVGNNALVAEWDATSYNAGPPPFLRRLDTPKHYPEDWAGEVHADAEIIDGAWWSLRQLVGNIVGDRLVVEGLFYTGTTATFQDYADGVVAADQALYGGAHLGYIFQAFGNRGIGPTYLLDVTHTPLGDTENTAGPYHVTCTIAHTSPITGPNAVQIEYQRPGDPGFTTVTLTPTGGLDEWAGDIPGPGVNGQVSYAITVTDDAAISARLPSVAGTYFAFTIGPDSQPPVITHTALINQTLYFWPPMVRAVATDNLGIQSVVLEYTVNGVPQTPLPMALASGNTYEAAFPATPPAIGDSFAYTIIATDASSMHLVTTHGPHSFTIIDAIGTVLILNDDLSAAGSQKYLADKTLVDIPPRDPSTLGLSADEMASVLTTAGWVVTQEAATASDPSTWHNYSLLISSSGNNTSPVANATYRANVEAYVAAGGKLLLEGGEVAYDAISYPAYPTFATNVVHGNDWDCDNCGGLVLATGMGGHPIMSNPFSIAPTLAITYAGYGDQDAFKQTAGYVVMGTNSYTNEAGILVYDNNINPESAQIVDYAFNWAALTDRTDAAELLQNTCLFLIATEHGADASIAGTCYVVGAPDNSGVTVTCTGAGSVVTGPSGTYQFTNLYAGTYTLTVAKDGYGASPQTVALGLGQHLTDVDFGLGIVREYQGCESPNVSIPDNNTTGITRSLVIPNAGILSNVYCSVNITHTWKGDLIVELVSPLGTVVRLHNRTGSSADNVITTYDSITMPDGPGTMNDFDGQNPAGTWELRVWDRASGDIGRLNSWCLDLFVAEEVVGNLASPLAAAAGAAGVDQSWTYESGSVDGFNLYRRLENGTELRLNSAPLSGIDGRISFTDPAAGLPAGTKAWYSYAPVRAGREIGRSEPVLVTLGGAAPSAFALLPVYPNPFNPSATVKFAVPRAGHVVVRVYDLAGRVVRTLVDSDLPAAMHTVVWDGVDDHGQRAGSGTYYCRMSAHNFTAVQKMSLIK